MKSVLLGLLLSLVLASGVRSQVLIRAERPAWQVGDTWTWRFENSGGEAGQRTNTVLRIQDFRGRTAYVVSPSAEDVHYVMDDDLNVIAYLDKKSGSVRGERTGLRYRDWPLEVGKSWKGDGTQIFDGQKTIVEMTLAVEAHEEVAVPAGTFQSFRVVARSQVTTPQGRQFTQEEVMWWAPSILNRARYTRKTSTGFSEKGELVSYSIMVR